MRNCVILLFSLLVCGQFLFAELPPAFTSGGDPELYETLMDKAKDNLKKLDGPRKKEYRRMLREQDDILMAYLLAYESDAGLCQAEPRDILSNYRQIRLYLETYGTSHPAEFFLSYVADQTVSDERIEAYREALLDDGLREILQTSDDELELYRAVSHWCVSRLKFTPTSGRDQSPLDITQKSFLGRCEEMQILFVAAARTVGLPARAASVSWWPHTDNNHAWAEVWLDGAWHYTGDMDTAYYPDQTWFSGLIDKTVLILADGTLPSENDEVLHQGKYECVINSTPNYAGEHTRTLKIQTVDAQGDPLPRTELRFLVYNWNSLRSLVAVETDDEGNFEISVGRGAFYVSASKDGLDALQLVPSGDQTTLEYTLVLKEGSLPDQNAMLDYPANEFEHQQAPREWKDAVAEAKALWQERDEMFRERRDAEPDSLIGAFAAAGRGNLPELEEFLRRHPSPDEDFLRFVTSEDPQYLDPKFLWQANASQIEALYVFYLDHDWGSYSSDELSALIDPAVFYEELPQPVEYRDGVPQLYPENFFFSGETNLE
ncbi:MAG: transglutaminase-like domain-containing protein, partial [Candidatus Syntrophosphaera sp.]